MSVSTMMTERPARGAAADAPHELVALRSGAAVRERCEMVYRHVAEGRSPHFTLELDRLDDVAAEVASITRETYPDLAIPYHSRWRHFSAGGVDRWGALLRRLGGATRIEVARAAIDLATVSVLLDAGAGDAWSYREPDSDRALGRSEGLAVASFYMFCAGAFSSRADSPLQVDGAGLANVDAATLGRWFQMSGANPLPGLDKRAALLQRLGAALAARPDLFGADAARPGHLLDHFLRAGKWAVEAPSILAALLDGLSSIWPSGLVVEGVALGDAAFHPAVRTNDGSDGIVPFHKLTQWLTYSLLEPFENAGLRLLNLDALTGLPEYRNGGLLIDLGVIVPRRPLDPQRRHEVRSELIVEWRALTVALLDRLIEPVRTKLCLEPGTLSLAQMLQGGTWAAGRRIAARLRPPAGPPPIQVAEDGTVF